MGAMRQVTAIVHLLLVTISEGFNHDTFDPGVWQTSPSNIGGWRASHGNVACNLDEDVDQTDLTDCRVPEEVTDMNTGIKTIVQVDGAGQVPCWKVGPRCEQLQVQGKLKVRYDTHPVPYSGISVAGFGDHGILALQQSITSHPSLVQLGLQTSDIGKVGAKALATIIRAEIKLRYKRVRANNIKALYLTLNRLGPEGTREIVEALKWQQRATGPAFMNNDGIENLYLDSNVIGDLGAKAIAELIGPNNAGFVMGTLMRIISLRSNRITDVGATALLAALNNNGNLLALMLEGNNIRPQLMESIRLRLDSNCCSFLENTIRMRRQDQGASPSDAEREAFEIREFYRVKSMCCERVGWERCV